MIRQRIMERLKKNNSPIWIWQNYNDLWNDLKHEYGTSEGEFKHEIERLLDEGRLLLKKQNDKFPTYYLGESFMNELGIKK